MSDDPSVGREVVPLEPPTVLRGGARTEWDAVVKVQHALADDSGKHWIYADQAGLLAAYCELYDPHHQLHIVRSGLVFKLALALGLLTTESAQRRVRSSFATTSPTRPCSSMRIA